MEEDIVNLLVEFADKHNLGGEDGYFSDVEDKVKRSDDIKNELPDLVSNLYKCFQP